MRISRLAKNLLNFLPVLAVMAATALGLLLGNELYPTTPDSRPETLTEQRWKPDDSQPPIVSGAESRCAGPLIFTSLPPKCKTLEGTFIPLVDMFPNVVMPPKR